MYTPIIMSIFMSVCVWACSYRNFYFDYLFYLLDMMAGK